MCVSPGEDAALVTVEFLVGPGGPENMTKQIAGVWQSKFGHAVLVKKRVDRNLKGIVKVSARDGAVVFWDDAKMVAYRENPFLSLGTMRAWVDDMTNRHLPKLLESMRAAGNANARR